MGNSFVQLDTNSAVDIAEGEASLDWFEWSSVGPSGDTNRPILPDFERLSSI